MTPRLLRRAGLATLAALTTSVVLAMAGWWLSHPLRGPLLGRELRRVPAAQGMVALTLDDGPWPDHLDDVLEVLDAHGARATFFVQGEELIHRTELGRKILSAGHELGNHSASHRRMIFRTQGFIERELQSTDEAIRAAGQPGQPWFRPPYGRRLISLPLVLERDGRPMVMWDVDGDPDPRDAPEVIARRVLDEAQPGSIVLLHVLSGTRDNSRAALPLILEGLAARGLRVVTLSELVAAGS